ncbi:MAG: DUF2807 domain-containing protein [Eudoraea sp.]|uniref:GIN domain-containing protein n=1 Tax=Eudoraea sp. TaxID=1979955 RepID=UPI003C74027F
MKNIIIFFIAFTTLAVSAQRKPKIKGNKSIVEVNEDLPFFNAIEVRDDLEIILKETAIPGYSISADDNLIDILRFDVVDSTLVIRSFYKITAKKQLEITVNFNELKRIIIQQGKVITKDMINSDELKISTYGSSKLVLNARASIMNILMEGNSTGDFNLQSDSLNLNLRDKVNLNLYGIISNSNIEMYNNSSAEVEGTLDTLNIKLFGSSNLKAQKMEAGVISADLEETTRARLYAYKSIELSSSGAAKTYLWGNPKIILKEFLNTSELYKREE